jgi:curved DNA-binding protein CbpA
MMASLSRLQILTNTSTKFLKRDLTDTTLVYSTTRRNQTTQASKKKKDHYEVLGLDRQAEGKEVRNAFYRLSKQYHPDVNKEEGASEKFQDLTDAYEVLSSPDSRAAYDRQTQMQASSIVVTQRPSSAMKVNEDYTQFFKERREQRKAHDAKRAQFKSRPPTNVKPSGGFNHEQNVHQKPAIEFAPDMETLPKNYAELEVSKFKARAESGFLVGCLLFSVIAGGLLFGQETYESKGIIKERKRIAEQLKSSI